MRAPVRVWPGRPGHLVIPAPDDEPEPDDFTPRQWLRYAFGVVSDGQDRARVRGRGGRRRGIALARARALAQSIAVRSALLALVLTACSCASPDRSVYVASEGLADEVTAAMDAWNAALERACPEVHLTPTRDPHADILVAWGDEMPAGLSGLERDGQIRIDPEAAARWPSSMPAVVAHELGHALGAPHSADPADLMFAPVHVGRAPTPTAADVAAVCTLWGLL